MGMGEWNPQRTSHFSTSSTTVLLRKEATESCDRLGHRCYKTSGSYGKRTGFLPGRMFDLRGKKLELQRLMQCPVNWNAETLTGNWEWSILHLDWFHCLTERMTEGPIYP